MKTIKVELLKPHTDAGRQYQPGDVLELHEDQARWLVAIGAAKALTKLA